jgi:adenylate cyclase
MSGDPEQEYFSDGIADDIITELSRSRSLFVIARNSSFAYRGQSIDVRQIAHELGVRYVVEGSVRRSGGRVRVTAQLIDADTGNHIWADRYDRDVNEVFTVQDEITASVTLAILPAVAKAEQQRALRRPPESLGAWEAYQRGLWHLAKGIKELDQAETFLRRAIELDPLFAGPHGMLAFASTYRLGGQDSFEAAEVAARKAIELDPEDAGALAALAWLLHGLGRTEAALEQAEHAILVNPNDVGGYLGKGAALVHSGRPDEAQQPLLMALRLSPRDPLSARVLMMLILARYFSGEYAEVANLAQRAIRDYPSETTHYRWLAAALGQLGRTDEARQALHQAIAQRTFDFYVRSRPPWYRPEDHEHMLDGLRKAGWDG